MGVFISQFLVSNDAFTRVTQKQWNRALRKVAQKMQEKNLIQELRLERYDTATFIGDKEYFWDEKGLSSYAWAEWSDLCCTHCNRFLTPILKSGLHKFIQQRKTLEKGGQLLFDIIPEGFFVLSAILFTL
jgi:methionyl-tRNA synthetase